MGQCTDFCDEPPPLSDAELQRFLKVHQLSVDEIGDPKKSSGHYKVSKSVLLTLYSV